ncbi:carbohydrate ABC transporter permease [Streptococcus thoraltensis]|uniref:carbohydrate ABC transporter permease n=1 Tax=Streptococcus thoraltensis TaxID=55085 RepID=UPI000375992F|nr:sugar ABC transporter permease [Streptococcus thoraltensis]MDY4762123.1 sugar ABC transporter permease [Streptococcus thoraltensis]
MKKNKLQKKWSWWTLLFVSPFLVLFITFFLLPAVMGLYVSFTNWDIYSTPIWVGLENFKTILFDKTSIWHTQFVEGFRHTFLFALITVPFCIIVPLFLAVLLMNKPRFMGFFQAVLYMPSLFAISAVMIIWAFLLSISYGPQSLFGLDIFFTGEQPWAWFSLALVTVWWTMGSNLIIYVASLNGVNSEMIEAAQIDGASRKRIFFSIQLPSIRDQLLFTTVMTSIAQLNVYGQPLMLTNGGPNGSTSVLLMYIQQAAFSSGIPQAGMASAMSILLGLGIMLVSVFQFIAVRKMNQ